ncbi:hypothetical protein DB35_05335 [Streptomyces abyssalis]|uniref:Uncharacterized protein n=1 Tax=Streptomyces abyssalis TaxID=933944 RepID=A0A1E7JQR9_9ACTN|nr:hypothetical protein [Streptomyces abyssalis]OEU90584.1 hypothetical protein AN215_14410 [Streptomyces abyssalis]OEU95323.1 hypothetical protein DB35_05335 [Streptomyces abyssalis]OEV31014.1 hypothetical protein AN219_07465 [Streptomyces nanshensis]
MNFATSRPRTPPAAPECARGYDALVLTAEAGLALLRRPGVRTGPVAYDHESGCVQLLVPEGSAEELPGLLEWLEWGGIELGLAGRAPYDPREAAVWLRPPEPGLEADRVDLVRLVSAAATECHRARLRSTAHKSRDQPLAFS